MWVSRQANAAGIFLAEDIEALRELVAATLPEGATEYEKGIHAMLIMRLFIRGVNNAEDVRAAMRGEML
jgi:hypothetical protein